MTDEVSVETGLGKVKLTGKNILVILCLVAAGAGLFGVYLLMEHKAEAKSTQGALAEAFKDMARAQRETACIVAYRQSNSDPREVMDFCRQVTR